MMIQFKGEVQLTPTASQPHTTCLDSYAVFQYSKLKTRVLVDGLGTHRPDRIL